jgi:hypothetical protein
MKPLHLSVLMQILRLTAISSILYLHGEMSITSKTPQYRQRMHHRNPEKQCQEVDILYACSVAISSPNVFGRLGKCH